MADSNPTRPFAPFEWMIALRYLRAKRKEESKPLQPFEAQGMSREEVLNYFYGTTTFKNSKKGWMSKFDPDRILVDWIA